VEKFHFSPIKSIQSDSNQANKVRDNIQNTNILSIETEEKDKLFNNNNKHQVKHNNQFENTSNPI